MVNPKHKSFEHFDTNNYKKDLLDYGNISDKKTLKYAGITDIERNIQIIRDAINTIQNKKVQDKCHLIYDRIVYNENATGKKEDEEMKGGEENDTRTI